MPRHLPTPCQDLIDLQQGVIARWQLAQADMSVRVADIQLHVGRWQPLYRGVYATFTGEPSRMAVLWAAALRGGPDAALSHHTAAELDRLVDEPSGSIHVTVYRARQITISGREGQGLAPKIIIHRGARLNEARHSARVPPRTRIEETTLDLVQVSTNLDQALSWLITACARRLTRPELLLAAMEKRARLRWRTEAADAWPMSAKASTHSWSGGTYAALRGRTGSRARAGKPRARPTGALVTSTTATGTSALPSNSMAGLRIRPRPVGATSAGTTPAPASGLSRSGTAGQM